MRVDSLGSGGELLAAEALMLPCYKRNSELHHYSLLRLVPQEKPLKVSGTLQNGRQPVGVHGHRLRHEGVRLVAGEGLQLRQAEEEHHAAQRRVHEAAGRVRGHPGRQVGVSAGSAWGWAPSARANEHGAETVKGRK